MTPEQVDLVQSSWEHVLSIKEKAAQIFYTKLFQLDPELKPLFKGDIIEQGNKLMTMIDVAVRNLKRIDAVAPTLRDLGARHAAYGVKAEDYATVGAAFLATLEIGLGPNFTPETREAWTVTYAALAGLMQAYQTEPSIA